MTATQRSLPGEGSLGQVRTGFVMYWRYSVGHVHYRNACHVVRACIYMQCMYVYLFTQLLPLAALMLHRYLFSQVALAAGGEHSILEPVTMTTADGQSQTLYAPKPSVTFHFFSSQAPCETVDVCLCLRGGSSRFSVPV